MTYRLGIDLGGTSAKIGLVSERAKIITHTSVPTEGFPNAANVVDRIASGAFRMIGKKKIKSVGVGVAGDVDSKKGIVRVSPNLGWSQVRLGELFKKKFKTNVIIENDANAAAWGIYKTQVPSTIKNLIVMTLGTGVGGGIIIDGKLFSGATGSAGEVGHMVIDEKGPLCNCGQRGCLETYVGAPHLINRVKRDLVQGASSSLKQIDQNELTPKKISEAALRGDVYAQNIWKNVGYYLGLAVGDLIYLLNPQMVVFTGGIAQAKNLILLPLKEKLTQRPFRTPIQATKIKMADHAPDVGVIGASLL